MLTIMMMSTDNMENNPAKDIATQMRQQQNLEREVESIKDKMEILEEMAKVRTCMRRQR